MEQQSISFLSEKKKVSFSVRPFFSVCSFFFFFLMWTTFKVYIEFVAVLSLFCVLASWLLGIKDSNALDRG